MVIRKARINDLDAVADIYARIVGLEQAKNLGIGWIAGVYPTRDTASQALKRDDLFVMEADAQVTAAAIINMEQLPEYAEGNWKYRADCTMVIHTLVVDPAKSGLGFGQKFINFYERYALENGCQVLRLDTNIKNRRARSFYAKLGYEEAGCIECQFNNIPDVKLVLLEKLLPRTQRTA